MYQIKKIILNFMFDGHGYFEWYHEIYNILTINNIKNKNIILDRLKLNYNKPTKHISKINENTSVYYNCKYCNKKF
jgi:hypothetical protein